MREGDFYGAKETLLASGGKSYVQYTGQRLRLLSWA